MLVVFPVLSVPTILSPWSDIIITAPPLTNWQTSLLCPTNAPFLVILVIESLFTICDRSPVVGLRRQSSYVWLFIFRVPVCFIWWQSSGVCSHDSPSLSPTPVPEQLNNTPQHNCPSPAPVSCSVCVPVTPRAAKYSSPVTLQHIKFNTLTTVLQSHVTRPRALQVQPSSFSPITVKDL